jgi:hypothetical protein
MDVFILDDVKSSFSQFVLGGVWGFLLPPPLAAAGEINSWLAQCDKVTAEYLGGGCQLGFTPPDHLFPMGMGGGFAMNALEGMDLRCDGGNGVVDVSNGFEASLYTPLNSYPLVLGNSGGSSFECSDWVVQRVKEIHMIVGICCVGSEEQFLALLIAIEIETRRQQGSTSSSKQRNKGNRELKKYWSDA